MPAQGRGMRPAVTSGPARRRRRAAARTLLGALALGLLLVGASVAHALTAPGTDGLAARLAEWGRGHGLSSVIDQLERASYRAPKVGGRPPVTSPLAAGAPARPVIARHRLPMSALPPVAPLASPALPGEGRWHVLDTVGGRPALQEAFLRPDAVHTSYTAGVVWMDTSLLRFVLHPGTQEPGGRSWPQTPQVSAQERPWLLAAFNGGFRLDAARGGFYEAGRTAGRLRVGAASLVVTQDGRAHVGQWGRDVSSGPTVVAVRQNLDLLVDGGSVVPGLDSNARSRWGATVGNRRYVWRSGVGQTASGALVYVAGNRLSAATLAELLRRAGCVRAMELDINAQWTSVVYPAERNLLPDMHRSPRRYDSTSSRDFVAVLRRGD
jgi:hypothetical protein